MIETLCAYSRTPLAKNDEVYFLFVAEIDEVSKYITVPTSGTYDGKGGVCDIYDRIGDNNIINVLNKILSSNFLSIDETDLQNTVNNFIEFMALNTDQEVKYTLDIIKKSKLYGE